MSLRAWFMLVTLSVIWGGVFFFYAVLVNELSPFSVVFGRVTIGFVVLYAVVRIQGRSLDLVANWRSFMVMGFINNFVPFNLIVFGQTYIESGLASIFNAMTPFFTIIFAFFLAKEEEINARKLFGVVLGVVGVAVLMNVGTGSIDRDTLIGGSLVILATICYALAGIFGRRFRGVAPEVSACGMLLFAALFSFPMSILNDAGHLFDLSLAGYGALVGLGVVGTAVAFILYFTVLRMAGAVNVLLVTLLIPVSATTLGVLFLGETVSGSEALGMAIVGLGLLVVDGRIFRLAARRRLSGGGMNG